MGVLLAKLALALACAAALHALWICRERWARGPRAAWIVGCFVVKAAAAAALLGAFGPKYLRSDVRSCFVPEFSAAFAPGLVYRDFTSAYNPLFPYVVGLFYRAGGLMGYMGGLLACEAVLCALVLGLRPRSETAWTAALVLLLFSPLSVTYVLIEGQEDFLVLAALALPLAAARSALAAGALFAFAYLSTKWTAALAFVPALWGAERGRATFAVSASAIVILAYAGLVLAGSDPLMVVRVQSDQVTSGNLPHLLAAAGVPVRACRIACYAVFLLGCAWVCARLARTAPSKEAAGLAYASLWCLFMIFAQKTLGAYFLSFLPFFLLPAIDREPDKAPFWIWAQVPLAVHHSVWFRAGDLKAALGGGAAQAVQILVSAAVLAVSAAVLVRSVRWMETKPS